MTSGIGLGLSITKNLAEVLGGQVMITSEIGEYTEVTIKINVEAVQKSKKLTPLNEDNDKFFCNMGYKDTNSSATKTSNHLQDTNFST